MLDRRQALAGAAAAALPTIAASPKASAALSPFASRRPPPSERKFSSPALEALIKQVGARIGDAKLRWIFENALPNTLDTTVEPGQIEGGPDTFVITGDIPCMWLRDSSAQVQPYLGTARKDPALQHLLAGVIARQARCILIDPYANAFMRDPSAKTDLSWAQSDQTEMKPGVAERKWEINSLVYPMRLAYRYWRTTGDVSPFDSTWRAAMARAVETLRVQQRKAGPGPYRFQRKAESPTETLMLDGYGAPTRKVGLIHSMFRASDDACVFPFLIPDNFFAVIGLRELAELNAAVGGEAALSRACKSLSDEVGAALDAHGRFRDADGGAVWAYEVDGYGNRVFMDDANAPGLLSLPYLGVCAADDPVYRRTRERVLSPANPYFFAGKAGEGVGGPHEGLRMIWPMSIIFRALTSLDDNEIRACLKTLRDTDAGAGFIHEAFDQDDASKFTRPWFAWANSLFGELILGLAVRKPALLAEPFA